MTIVRALITIPTISGLPEDYVTNTLLFGTTEPSEDFTTELDTIYDALVDFWETGGTPLQTILSDRMVPEDAYVRFYDLSEAVPRVPLGSGTYSLGLSADTGGGNAMPGEVALCLSFEAARLSGVDQARRRGRIYIGQLSTGVMDLDTGRPNTGTINAIRDAGAGLLTASEGAALWSWVVLNGLDAVSSTTAAVAGGWCDNEYDTMRKRSLKKTARAVFP